MTLPFRRNSETPSLAAGGDASRDLRDPAVFDALVRELYVPLCRTAAHITRSYDMAEDVVTEVLVAVWRRRAEMGSADTVRGYLHRAVHNRALTAVAGDRLGRCVPLENAHAVVDTRAAAAVGAPLTELEQALDRAVAALPERCRTAYLLSREDGLTYAEIADVMGVSTKTVAAQLCRALVRIRRALDPYLG